MPARRLARGPPANLILSAPVSRTASLLPRQGTLSRWVRASEAVGLAGAAALVVANGARSAAAGVVGEWWAPIILVAALVAADFLTGCIHWAADTWGSEDLPVIGPRLIRPFRVHHVNPDDFLSRDVLDANGDVALLALPLLAAALLIPLDTVTGRVASLALASLATCVLPTNQVHQWAHCASPPRAVGWLQRAGVLLGPGPHSRHHTAPFVDNYCILTGWCNRPLAAIQFFPRLERVIAAITGAEPRRDDAAFAARAE
jgi:ubiquitin-conjugating enzyme E2 variant